MFKQLFLFVGVLALFGSVWWSADVQKIGAGVAIFLFGILSMDEGFRAFTGGTLEKILNKSTNKQWKSFSFGFVVSTLVQSSSLVSVISISFLSSGLLSLTQGIGIIFGANIGTTTGAWLMATVGLKVNVSVYAMPMLMVGIVLVMQNKRTLKGLGHISTGLGFLFLGIYFMKDGFEAFRATIDLTEFAMTGWAGILVYTLIGMLATVIMQSSHASLILIITALTMGQVTYDNAIALTIGANVGTTITAIIAAIGANSSGRQLAAAHFIFKSTTAFFALILIGPLITFVDGFASVLGIAPTQYALKLSLFHTVFNVMGVAILLPFVSKITVFLKRVIRDDRRRQIDVSREEGERRKNISQPKYVSPAVMTHPDTALSAIILEVFQLWRYAIVIIESGLLLDKVQKPTLQGNEDSESTLTEHDHNSPIDDLILRYIRPLNSAILEASSRIPKPISKTQSETLFSLKLACRDIVNAIKDVKHLQKNVLKYRRSENAALQVTYSEFRSQLSLLLNELLKILNIPDEEEALLKFSEQHRLLQKNDIVRNGKLDSFIEANAIPSKYITSLMNDSQYCLNISTRVLKMAQSLYWAQTGSRPSTLQMLTLDDNDVSEIRHEQ
jgi:phosphate:Na+ symporter